MKIPNSYFFAHALYKCLVISQLKDITSYSMIAKSLWFILEPLVGSLSKAFLKVQVYSFTWIACLHMPVNTSMICVLK